MKTIVIPRIVNDLKYQAKDGEFFSSPDDCKVYEEKLYFKAFVLDEKKVKGPLTEENWQHCIFSLLNKFYNTPIDYANLLQKYPFEGNDWKDNKYVNTGFDLEKVKRILIDSFNNIPDYDYEFNKKLEEESWGKRDRFFGNQNYNSNLTRIYKENIRLFEIYDFLFSNKLLNIEDLLKYTNSHSRFKTSNEEESKEDLLSRIYLKIFNTCFKLDSPESLDCVVEHINLDLEYCLNYCPGYVGWYGGGDKFVYDFFSSVCYRDFDENNNNDYDSKLRVDDKKRLKWVEYFIKKDPKIKLFKYKPVSSADIKNLKIITYTVDDLIEQVKSISDNELIFLFQKTSKKIIDLLTKAGPNFIKSNKDNKKPKFYKIAEDVQNKIKEIFSNFPEMIVSYNKEGLFSIKRTLNDNRKEGNYRFFYEINVIFYVDALDREHDKETNVVIVNHSKNESYDRFERSTIKKISLNNYKGGIDKLASELAYYLNNELPFGPDEVEKIKNIEDKLLSIEKQKEHIDKQKELLEQEKEKLKRLIPKKK